MAYQHSKDFENKESASIDPYALIMNGLTGLGVKRPKKNPAFVLWGKANSAAVEQLLRSHPEYRTVKNGRHVGLRQKAVTELFCKLSKSDKEKWEGESTNAHQAAIKEWETRMKEPPSTKAEARQRYASICMFILHR